MIHDDSYLVDILAERNWVNPGTFVSFDHSDHAGVSACSIHLQSVKYGNADKLISFGRKIL